MFCFGVLNNSENKREERDRERGRERVRRGKERGEKKREKMMAVQYCVIPCNTMQCDATSPVR